METLEDRRVLANQIVLDFSPDIIDSEYQVERFSSVFASEPVSVSNQFLDYNSDGMISGDDAEIALHRISARVHRLLKPYREHADIDLVVWKSTDLASQVDPGAGETRLASGQASSSLNTYVIYVGNNRPSELLPKFGAAHQAFAGVNNEFYGFVFGGGIREYMASDLIGGSRRRS